MHSSCLLTSARVLQSKKTRGTRSLRLFVVLKGMLIFCFCLIFIKNRLSYKRTLKFWSITVQTSKQCTMFYICTRVICQLLCFLIHAFLSQKKNKFCDFRLNKLFWFLRLAAVFMYRSLRSFSPLFFFVSFAYFLFDLKTFSSPVPLRSSLTVSRRAAGKPPLNCTACTAGTADGNCVSRRS